MTPRSAWIAALLVVAFNATCAPEPYDECNPAPDPYATSYEPRPDVATPLGVRVDRRGQNVDLNRVDAAVAQVEACLGRPIRAECLRVYVPERWQVSCESSNGGRYMLLSDHPAPPEACEAKGFDPDPRCPCLWRVLTQGSTIIAPPDLRMLPAGIVSVATGIADPWPGDLAECAAPLPPMARE